MAVDLSNWWYLDGADVWQTYSLIFKKGTTDALQYPERKESITHNWPDKNGLDVDLAKVFFKERTFTLECHILAYTEGEFWTKYTSLLARLAQPGTRRLTIKAHGNRSYFVFYLNCTNYRQEPGLTIKGEDGNMVMHSFNLILQEPEPQIDYVDTFIAADDGAFIIG